MRVGSCVSPHVGYLPEPSMKALFVIELSDKQTVERLWQLLWVYGGNYDGLAFLRLFNQVKLLPNPPYNDGRKGLSSYR